MKALSTRTNSCVRRRKEPRLLLSAYSEREQIGLHCWASITEQGRLLTASEDDSHVVEIIIARLR